MAGKVRIKSDANRIKPWYAVVSGEDTERLANKVREEKEFVFRTVLRKRV